MQAQVVIPMATSLAFGILFATIITLILVPTLYVLLDDVKRVIKGKRQLKAEARKAALAVDSVK